MTIVHLSDVIPHLILKERNSLSNSAEWINNVVEFSSKVQGSEEEGEIEQRI